MFRAKGSLPPVLVLFVCTGVSRQLVGAPSHAACIVWVSIRALGAADLEAVGPGVFIKGAGLEGAGQPHERLTSDPLSPHPHDQRAHFSQHVRPHGAEFC